MKPASPLGTALARLGLAAVAVAAGVAVAGLTSPAIAQERDPSPPNPFPDLPAGVAIVTTLHAPVDDPLVVDCAQPPTAVVTDIGEAGYACVAATNTTSEPIEPFWHLDGDLQPGHVYVDGLDVGETWHRVRTLPWSVDVSGVDDLAELQARLDALVDSGAVPGPYIDAAEWSGGLDFEAERPHYTGFAEMQARWERLDLRHYEYTVVLNCFCYPFEGLIYGYRVTVIDGEVASAVARWDGTEQSMYNLSIDSFFARLEDARSDEQVFVPGQTSTARWAGAQFDVLYSVPTYHWIDWNEWIFDEEFGATVSDFTPLIPCRGGYVDISSCPSPEEAERGDVNCDGAVDIVDALEIARLDATVLGDAGTCPQVWASAVYAANGDMNQDGFVDIIDAFLVAQCDAGISGPTCPPSTPGGAESVG